MFNNYRLWKKSIKKRNFDVNKNIMKNEIDNYVLKGAVLIDVRSPQEYREGHLKNAILMPHYQIKRNIQKVIQNKNQLIVLYCSTGHRGQVVQDILEKLGYTNVYNVYDGIE